MASAVQCRTFAARHYIVEGGEVSVVLQLKITNLQASLSISGVVKGVCMVVH